MSAAWSSTPHRKHCAVSPLTSFLRHVASHTSTLFAIISSSEMQKPHWFKSSHVTGTIKGMPCIFHWGAKTERRPRAGGGVLAEWAATPSPPAMGVWGCAESSPSGVRGGTPTAQRFPLFSELRMASLDTIILLMDYHAATGARPPCPSVRTPLGTINAHCFFYSPTGAV